MSSAARRIATRWLPIVLVLTATACSDEAGDEGSESGTVPTELTAFVERIAEPGGVPFHATYSVLQKFGGETSTVEVAGTPPAWQVHVDDVAVTGGDDPETCVGVPATCVDRVDEARLTSHGVSSSFFARGPGLALEDTARNIAGEPAFTTRTEAGVELECATVADRTVCITPEGVVGLIDDSVRLVKLTSYTAG